MFLLLLASMDLSVAPEQTGQQAATDSSGPESPAEPSPPPAGDTTPPAGSPHNDGDTHKLSPSSPAAQTAALPPKSAATGAVPRHPLSVTREPGPDDVIFVTGFGPFGHHEVNASWQAVSRLHSMGVGEQLGAKLIIEEVPVKYEYVMREIPRRWKQLRPRLVVHVGVSSYTMTLQLERVAHNGPYCRGDVLQQTPPEQRCLSGQPSTLCCRLDLARTCRAIGGSASAIDATVSDDPGHYLCGFIYFMSLAQDPARTVFVHVPPLGMPYTANQMATGLAEVVRDLWHQVLQLDQPPPRPLDLSCSDQQRP
ncbi:pyroglutamyl-peptidase 1-like isoform X1 [Amphibalanus amphitrite]|uniref:pyroglutamyl-peptidase 1-like isoform X1 n=2 Tax=Amphibalanus amphitrite TaxID=1232801 RepID=UPI001C918528|nr:pyroglutamyl-peptidase 1-like isoform X1 [Amphibalanus amphitrite]